jgi:hypothetical protein
MGGGRRMVGDVGMVRDGGDGPQERTLRERFWLGAENV